MSPVKVSRQTLELPGTRGAEVPVLSVRSGVRGPVAVVTANLHGDECIGLEAIRRLHDSLPSSLECGSVHLYPTLNPRGLQAGVRNLPEDRQDPNRAFPGDATGRAVEQHAFGIWENILSREPDLVVDLHSDSTRAIPYAIVDRVLSGDEALGARCEELAEATGLTVIREYPRERYLRYRLDRSLPGALVNHASIAAITVEAGPRNVLGSKEAQLVRDSVMSVLGCAGLTAWSQATHPTNRNQGGPWRRESGPRCRHTGLLISLLEPGHKFAARQPLAEVHDLTGRRLETLCAKTSGIVVALPDRAWVTEGVSCATLAVPDE